MRILAMEVVVVCNPVLSWMSKGIRVNLMARQGRGIDSFANVSVSYCTITMKNT